MPWPLVILAAAAVVAGVSAVMIRRRTATDELSTFVGFDTMFGRATIFTVRQDEDTGLHLPGQQPGEQFSWIRVMEIDGAYQSATYLDERCYTPVFDYYKLFDRAFDVERQGGRIEHTLMLGGGGYAYPKYLISTHLHASMDVVEIDPMITAIAERYFFLDRLIVEYDLEENGRLQTINEDARAYLESSNERYDAIMNDLFAGRAALGTLATIEAAQLVRDHLNPGGVYLANVISPLQNADGTPTLIDSICTTLAQVFANVYVIPCRHRPATEPDNHMVIATDGSWHFDSARRATPAKDAPILADATTPERIPIKVSK